MQAWSLLHILWNVNLNVSRVSQLIQFLLTSKVKRILSKLLLIFNKFSFSLVPGLICPHIYLLITGLEFSVNKHPLISLLPVRGSLSSEYGECPSPAIAFLIKANVCNVSWNGFQRWEGLHLICSSFMHFYWVKFVKNPGDLMRMGYAVQAAGM